MPEISNQPPPDKQNLSPGRWRRLPSPHTPGRSPNPAASATLPDMKPFDVTFPGNRPQTPPRNHAATMRQPCGNIATTMRQPCDTHRINAGYTRANHAATTRQPRGTHAIHTVDSHHAGLRIAGSGGRLRIHGFGGQFPNGSPSPWPALRCWRAAASRRPWHSGISAEPDRVRAYYTPRACRSNSRQRCRK
jgi:hypothetical protein